MGMKRFAVFAILAAAISTLSAQTPTRIETGHKLFQKNCSAATAMKPKAGAGPT